VTAVRRGSIRSWPARRQSAQCAAGGRGLAVAVMGLVLAAIAATAGAAVYKYVDANGHVVYSDQPPPGSVKSEIVKPPPPPANPDAARELEDKQLAIKQQNKKREEEANATAKARALSDQRREACVNALGQMKALQQNDVNLFRFNAQGERVYYTDEMRRAEFERQQQVVRDNCPG
jgi:hypothetical protein